MDWNLFWTAFGAIGGTLGALATFVAVIVALWQTKLNYNKKVQLSFMMFADDNKYKIWWFHFFNIELRTVEFDSDMKKL